jgi:diguanylate cyclase (GGDEF)-like protein
LSTVLIVDDSSAQRTALRATLEEASIFTRHLEAEDGLQALRLLINEEIDLVLCDVEMPGLEGEKLVLMSEGAAGRHIPFLMLTGLKDPERRARLLRQGARDVITKPYEPADLVARLTLHLELARLQSELEEKNRLLEHLSATDSLTGLANRRELDKRLSIETKRARRFGTPLCVLMADVDHFKAVNDTHGHPAGDEAIQHVARLLVARTREVDLAARYGGDELALVVSAPLEGARTLAETWRGQVELEEFQLPDGQTLSLTISIGVAEAMADDDDPSIILERADAALYQAKQNGRNCVFSAGDAEESPA